MIKVSQQKGFRHLRPAPSIGLYATVTFILAALGHPVQRPLTGISLPLDVGLPRLLTLLTDTDTSCA
jgi:hypothetical protein